MDHYKDNIERILHEYFEGNLSGELDREILSWMLYDGHEEEKNLFMERLWMEKVRYEHSLGSDSDMVGMLASIKQQLGLPEPEKVDAEPASTASKPTPRRTLSPLRKVAIRVAAVLIPVVVILGVYFANNRLPVADQDSGLAAVQDASVPKAVADTHTPVVSEMAEATAGRVELTDGSTVNVREGSVLSYSTGKEAAREVFLKGDAKFNIEKDDEGKPFVVRTEHMTITVYGTEFDVIVRPEDNYSKVILHRGVLSVTTEDGVSKMLNAGEAVTYEHSAGQLQHKAFVGKNESGDRVFVFDALPLEDIFRILEDKYNVAIECDYAALDKDKYELIFNYNEEMATVLEVLSTVSRKFEYDITNESVVITNL